MNTPPPEIAKLLADQVDALVPDLLPGARPSGGYWHAGNTAGDPGHSLYLRRGGPKMGRWVDAATGEFGDLLDPSMPLCSAGPTFVRPSHGLRLGLASIHRSRSPRFRPEQIGRSLTSTMATKRRSRWRAICGGQLGQLPGRWARGTFAPGRSPSIPSRQRCGTTRH